jgi:hypothetical protein
MCKDHTTKRIYRVNHVYPIGDCGDHILDGMGCVCRPHVHYVGRTKVVIHRSFDRREWAEGPVASA